ncbi:MAG: protein kinase, partial [bacterium]
MTGDLRAQLQDALGDTYAIERELGGGGMSRVFLAREVKLNREVVIKILPPGLAESISADRFEREIQLVASLQQANIVPLLAAGSANGVPYYVMPYVQSDSLRARLSNGPPLSASECASILRDIARALSYAHARGVVHRDIKPDNVLLSHGAAVVTDFGIAKAVSAARTMGSDGTLTQAGTSIGTPAYMAPEQVAGDPLVDHRADLYAWGCLAYELLMGAPPFVRESPQKVLAAHLVDAPVDLRTLRQDMPGLASVVMHCLAKAPDDRPATADEVLSLLDMAATPISFSSKNAGRLAAVGFGVTTRGKVMIALLVATALGLAAGAAWRGRVPHASAPAASIDRSIAVLPLVNLSGDKSDDYFGIGLAEEMTRALSKTGVRVIGRVSAGALQARGLDERAIAKELGVGSLLTGSVQRANGQVRINVSLLSASDGAVRWTEKYDRPLTNVFAVQDEIARSVAGKLLGSMGAAGATATRIETSDPEAYALYLQGQVLFNRRTAETLTQAIELYKRAAQRDPKFARAQASLAMAIAVLPSYAQVNTDTSLAQVTAAAQRAIAIDSTIAESYTALAYSNLMVGRNRAADALFQQALARDSSVATAWGWYGLQASHLGDFAEAHRRVARARELEPASLIARTWEAQILLNERRYPEADSATARTLALDSTFALAWSAHAEALLFEGHTGESVALLERRVALAPRFVTDAHGLLAYAYARSGQPAKARAWLQRLREMSGGQLPATGVLAAALEELGDHEAAI